MTIKGAPGNLKKNCSVGFHSSTAKSKPYGKFPPFARFSWL